MTYNKFKKTISIFLILFCIMTSLSACKDEVAIEEKITLTYVSADSKKIIEKKYKLKSTVISNQIEEVIGEISKNPEEMDYIAPLGQNFSIISKKLNDTRIILNLSKEYKLLPPATEILTRASIVRSLTQISGIESVFIQIEGEPYRDKLGEYVGDMFIDTFIDNTGDEFSGYEKIETRLYFANKEGDKLIAVNRTSAYNTNIPIEKYIIEALIEGPIDKDSGLMPTINPDVKLLSVLVQDGICYVNFDETFLKQVYEVKASIVIYSIVNSLCELNGINEVQISVEGKSDIIFRKEISLNEFFKQNSYIIEK